MKKTKNSSRIVETSLSREFRPLRTSPRKANPRVKKDLKRLNEKKKILSSTLIDGDEERRKKKKKLERIKKQLSFYSNEREDLKSILHLWNDDDDDEDFLTDFRSSLCFVNGDRRRALIFAPRSAQWTVEGLFTVEQLFGPPATILGFQLDTQRRYPIYNLASQSLVSVETSSSTSKFPLDDDQLRQIFAQHQIELKREELVGKLLRKTSKIHHGLAIFLVEELRSNWIETMREFAPNDEQDEDSTSKPFVQLWNNCRAFQDTQFRSISYSEEIRSTTEEILLSDDEEKPTRIFVCGAKDSGKSTFLRYLINRILSERRETKRIAFLDCDIGQSEFTPSGTISLLNPIDQPLFGPSATHLQRPAKSFFFGNIQVNQQDIAKYLNYVKSLVEAHRQQPNEILLINTMGWGADNGLIIMKELLDLIRPTTVVQLRSTNPYFRHPMPDLDPHWSRSASHWRPFRELHHLPLESLHEQYNYHLFVTPVRQHNQQGKSRLTRQMCLWAYFSQLNPLGLLFRPLIDHSHRMEIFSFQHISIGILHRQVRVKYFLQVLNASIVALGRIRPDLIFRPSNEFPALIDERASVDCLGFGFVRSIDMKRGEIHVLIPDGTVAKSQINALIKGNDDCPDEFYFLSIDRWRGAMPPYVTGLIN